MNEQELKLYIESENFRDELCKVLEPHIKNAFEKGEEFERSRFNKIIDAQKRYRFVTPFDSAEEIEDENGDSCHESAPRGSRTGTQGLKNARERGVIPRDLFIEIFRGAP